MALSSCILSLFIPSWLAPFLTTSALGTSLTSYLPSSVVVLWRDGQPLNWDGQVDYKMEVSWWAPSYPSFHVIVSPHGEPNAKPAEIYNLHAAIPETEFSCHYFYRAVRNYGDASMDQLYADGTHFVFSHDVRILKAQQAVAGAKDLFAQSPISFRGDRLQLEARKIIARLAGMASAAAGSRF